MRPHSDREDIHHRFFRRQGPSEQDYSKHARTYDLRRKIDQRAKDLEEQRAVQKEVWE